MFLCLRGLIHIRQRWENKLSHGISKITMIVLCISGIWWEKGYPKFSSFQIDFHCFFFLGGGTQHHLAICYSYGACLYNRACQTWCVHFLLWDSLYSCNHDYGCIMVGHMVCHGVVCPPRQSELRHTIISATGVITYGYGLWHFPVHKNCGPPPWSTVFTDIHNVKLTIYGRNLPAAGLTRPNRGFKQLVPTYFSTKFNLGGHFNSFRDTRVCGREVGIPRGPTCFNSLHTQSPLTQTHQLVS